MRRAINRGLAVAKNLDRLGDEQRLGNLVNPGGKNHHPAFADVSFREIPSRVNGLLDGIGIISNAIAFGAISRDVKYARIVLVGRLSGCRRFS